MNERRGIFLTACFILAKWCDSIEGGCYSQRDREKMISKFTVVKQRFNDRRLLI